MQVELIAIGNELLSGRTVNRNGAYLAKQLTAFGLSVGRQTTIPDSPSTIQQTLIEAMKRSTLVIATGGLGPTLDDVTMDSVRPLFSSPPTALTNRVGAAPGAFFHEKQKMLLLLPGVSREMIRMFEESATPILEQLFKKIPKRHTKTCTLCFVKEIDVDPLLRQMKKDHPEVDIGVYPALGSLVVSFTGFHLDEIEALFKEFRAAYPEQSFEGTCAEAVHSALREKKLRLALAESCTGGAIGARLTAIPDASQFFLGSFVVYTNGWKERFLGVSSKTLSEKGAVSAETVEEMVQGLFSHTEADIAAAVSGIAGPSGGTKEKPVGTIYIAVGKRGEKIHVIKIQAPKDRSSAIEMAIETTLGALWQNI